MTRKLFAVLILGIFLISLVSAEVFTFDNFKTYDEETKTISVKSILSLSKLADIKLETPLVNVVPMGYQKVAEFTLYNYGDYNKVFNDMDFYDMNKDGEEIYRDFEYKYLSVEYYTYNMTRTIWDNKTKGEPYKETYEVNGSRPIWRELKTADLKEGTYTIGIFTNVRYGDKIEWIPTYYGKRIDEWALYVQSSGTETTDGDYTIFTFTSNGYFNTTNDLDQVQILVVAGGGGGGGSNDQPAGGGGAGGVIYNNSNFSLIAGNYLVEVGAGGDRGCNGNSLQGQNGSNSLFGNDEFKMLAIGGGGGSNNVDNGYGGGSGGGAGNKPGGITLQGSANGTGYGNIGGTGIAVNGSGGGGATQQGEDATSKAGDGGDGILININGTNVYYAGGGGGADYYSHCVNGNAGIGGLGGGANGGCGVEGFNATGIGSGGGGGAGADPPPCGGDGTDGIIMIRYLTPTADTIPSVVLNSPDNFSNYSVSTITFNVSVTDNFKVQNVSLLIDEVIVTTNTSNVNGTYIFSRSLSSGYHNWSILAFDNVSQSNQSEYRYFNITILSPTINLYSPANNLITATQLQTFKGGVTDDFGITNVSLYLDTALNETNSSGVNGVNYTFSKILGEGSHNWYLRAFDNDSNPTDSNTRNLIIDLTTPEVLIVLPTNGTQYTSNYTDTNLTGITFNWTASDTNLDMCWYDNGSINIISCNTNQSLSVPFRTYNYRFFANDSANNTHSDLRTPNYAPVYFENAHTYNPTTTETFQETFTLNITIGTGVSLTSAYFNYGGSTYAPDITTDGNQKLLTKSIDIPAVSVAENKTFFWTLNSNQVNYNTTEINQTINPLSLDNCSVNTIQILNYTIYDEGDRTTLPAIQNMTSDVGARIGGDVNGVQYKQYNLTTTQNPITLCVNASLGTQNYRLDTEIQYKADDYVTEYHYLNNFTLNSSVIPKNVSLYLLKTLDSQEFLINYEDKNSIPQEGIYIELWRQYIDIAKFLQVEVAKTDNDGRTIGHFVLNDEIYNVYGYEEDTRELKFFYENVRAFCVDVTTGDCQINVQEQTAFENPDDLNNYLDVIGTEAYNDETKTYTFSFTTINGAKTINMTIYKYDAFLNEVVCSSEDTASSGTFTCVIPAEYYNGSVMSEIYVNSELYSTNIFYVSDLSEQGLNAGGFVLAFLLIITLPLLALGSGPMTLVFFIIGLALIGGMFLVNFGGFIGGFSAFLWLAVAGIILLIKASKRREQ